ncbi:hydrolase [Caballeronia calidae]|uniref:Hydrolase n=1 Tax=Caballeronia calidae TaxID=1777139 RepID=A0A158DBU8_9BURK|nr:alpha/beta fold hydrolase [Caballeronia calidae]SAK92049.1 hydrolase [Caballeronia calidae]
MKPQESQLVSGGNMAGTCYSLYASRAGESSETVVLIHGVGMNHHVWAPQIDFLTRHFQVLAFDMLGHGGSSLPSAQPALDEYAAQVKALLDTLNIESAHIVGHSMGALVALEFALSYSERTLSVAALNAVYDRSPEQRAAIVGRADSLDSGTAMAGVDDTIARWFGDPIPSSLKQSAHDLRHVLLTVQPVGYARTYRLFANSDDAHVHRLPELAVPALFLTGECDPNSSPDMSRAMAAVTPEGSAEIIAGARHMMSVTDPDEVNERLIRFLLNSSERVKADAETKGARHE